MHFPTASHFRIIFGGIGDSGKMDSGFQSVSGLGVDINVVLPHRENESFPVPEKEGYSILVLKRAARKSNESPLTRWLFSHFDKTNTNPLAEAQIELLDENQESLMTWIIRDIFPKSWKLSELNAEKPEILMETIELYYKEFRIQ